MREISLSAVATNMISSPLLRETRRAPETLAAAIWKHGVDYLHTQEK
uniref:Uncharacterized protein n=1 Tax=Candidatus Kentrum sp. MB TaxID=2138164 RepID=A0A450XT98_9GAMM|nr:MAG: hypothetical protein BECKMB1821G_GA0114241_103536 [Candidatus Kentron sp. MB]VFK32505.1 MAG: hypothetical protein BECKMB1821I_GA0114274_10344 [Candidatus Kentron sp. MB]VFK75951.1 MAG: hypothetical protein BECKMB1821H_GA0114242_10374 [Candidatus Kentron sp. MB]